MCMYSHAVLVSGQTLKLHVVQVLWAHADVLDLSKLYSNNIHSMADTYGIEAACKVVIKVLFPTACTRALYVSLCHST